MNLIALLKNKFICATVTPLPETLVVPLGTQFFRSEAPAMTIMIAGEGFQVRVENVLYTTDLYTFIRDRYLINTRRTLTMTPEIFWDKLNAVLMYQNRPLSKRPILLSEYNIPNFGVISLSFFGLNGGSKIMLPPYTILKECEEKFLKEYKNNLKLQSGEEQSAEFDKLLYFIQKNSGKMFAGMDVDWINIQVENFSIIASYASKCSGVYDYIKLTQLAYRLFTGKSLTLLVLKRIDALFLNEVQAFDTGDALRTLRAAFNMSSQVVDCELSKKLVGLYSYLLTQGFLTHFGLTLNDEDYSKMEQRALLSAYSSKKSFIMCALDATLFIGERLYEWNETGDISSFIHSGSEYSTWIKEADRILNLAPFTGNLKAHNTTYFAYLSDMRDAIEKGEAYSKHVTAIAGVDSIFIKRKLSSLQLLQNTEITRRAAAKERTAPMGVLLYGSSSIGKSGFSKIMYNYFGGLFDLPREDEFRYVRNPMDEYWSNFNSSMWCIQLDDIAFLNPVKSSTVDPTLQDLLNVVNNVPYVPPQAALEDKGKTPVMCDLVVATSNCGTLNAQEYFWCPLAVRRRLPFVVNITPKKEFLHSNQVFLDPSKIITEDGKYPDLWNIEVLEIKPILTQTREFAELKPLQMFSDINQFLAFFGKACVQHRSNQDGAMSKDKEIASIQVCKKCLLPGCVDCMEVQYGSSYFRNFASQCMLYLINWIVRWRVTMWCLDWMIQYKATCYLASSFVNNFADCDFNMQFFGGMTAKMRDPRIQKFVICVSALIACFGLYAVSNKYFSKDEKTAEQSSIDEELEIQGNKNGTTEEDLPTEESSNVWYNPTIELTTFDVPTASTSLVGCTQETVRDLFHKNCVLLRIKATGETTSRVMRGVFLKGHYCVTNGHAFKTGCTDFTVQIIRTGVLESITSNISVKMNRSDISFAPHNDLCVFSVESLPPFRDISKFWMEKFTPITSCVELIRDINGDVKINNVHGLMENNIEVPSLGRSFDVYYGHSQDVTESGMCGSLCVSMTPRGPIIVGLHFLGNEHHIGILQVNLGEILNLITSRRPIVQAGVAPDMTCSKRSHVLSEVHHKSVIKYVEKGVLNVYGSFSGFRPRPKSSVCETPLVDDFLEHYNTTIQHGKPAMSGWEPWRKNVLKMVEREVNYDKSVLGECIEAFADDIISGLDQKQENWESELVELSREAAINGLPGVKYIDKIATNTSMGFPWCTTKKEFLIPAKTEKHPEGVDFGPEVWDRVNAIEEKYKRGERAYPIFMGHLKDEATPLKKCEIKKTRLFTASPIDWNLVVRKHLLSFVRLLQKNKTIFEAAPGLVCQSNEWGLLRDYLTEFGDDRLVAGDFESFDKGMLADFILAAFEVIILVYKRAGASDDILQIISCIAEDTAFPVCNINGDLLEFFGSNPSGHPLTVIINSIVNSLYQRYCYHMLNPEREVKSFKKNVNSITYGDDNTFGVRVGCDWFNHTNIQMALRQINVGYTMADKGAESIPFIHIDDVSFLKRTWRWNAEVLNWVCPLEEASITKSLTMWVPSKTIDKYKQMVEVIVSANNEYFFYGKEKFEEKHQFFKGLLEREPYCFYVNEETLPGYLELVERFKRASTALTL
jgi:hypothetical protein